MAKKNQAPKAPKAPSAVAPTQEQTATVDYTKITPDGSYLKGLDPNHQVDLLKMMHETYRMDPDAAKKYHMTDEAVATINEVTAISQAAVLANEVVFAQNPFAVRMRATQLDKLIAACNAIGVTVNQKLITAAPAIATEEAEGENEVIVPSAAVQVSKETEKKIREEHAAAESAPETFDPTKIENDEQLAETLKQIMSKNVNAFAKITEPVNFYQSYLKVQASKSENKDEELKKINAMTRPQLFEAMAKFLVSAPIVLSGIGNFVYTITAGTKTPVPAFCTIRDASKNRKTGALPYSDEELAEITRILVMWECDLKTAVQKKKIADLESCIAVLKKDEMENALGIEDATTKIATCNENIKHFDDVRGYVTTPSGSVADEWPTMYAQKDNTANRIYGAIVHSYYDDIEIKEMKHDGVVHNVQQYIGVIHNLFREPSNQLQNYSASKILELQPVASTEEKPEESKK